MALVALAIGLDDPLGFGLFMIAAAPPAALIPAYADVAEVPGGDLLVFVLIAYGLALFLTPALVYLAAGELVGLGPIALTLGVGLIAPAVLARALHPQIFRIPQRVRRGLVNCTVVVICFGLGGGLFKGLDSIDATGPTLGVVVVALIARSVVGAEVASRVAPHGLQAEAPFAVAFKNVALAAAVGGSLAGSVAALPGLIGFPVEILYFLFLAQRRARDSAFAERSAGNL
jgi:predicted Na+-dependent transporter